MRRVNYRAALGLLALGASRLAAMDPAEARHLLARTGFGVAPAAQVEAFEGLDRAAAVDRILAGTRSEARTPPPAWVHEDPPNPRMMKMLPKFMKQSMRMEGKERDQALKAWWYREMVTTPSPLTERMTLFWHNHFTSSLQKSKWAPLMYFQNRKLRKHALGSFKAMLHALSKDPAMVIYLDNARNLASKPNENFAREVMELFTLGEGHYTEKDIKEAARAFTGWGVNRQAGTFQYRRRQHDYGVKTVLGETGELSGERVLDILLEQPACARYLTRKLWREFVGDAEPPAGEVERLAKVLRQGDYAIKPWLRALLTGDAFWAAEHRGTKIKSPVIFLVGTVRLLGLPVDDAMMLVRFGRQLGQDVMDPPNVKGWPGGKRWITSSTLLTRDQLLRRAFRGMEEGAPAHQLAALPPDAMRQVVLPVEAVNPIPQKQAGWQLLKSLLLDPGYQLH